jgi:hypothetical protein
MRDNFIKIYDNAFDYDFCDQFIEYIDLMESRTLVVPTDELSHKIDDSGINMIHHYDLKAWTWIGEQFLPPVQRYVQDYLNTYSILMRNRILLYDVKPKKIYAGGGFHDWHYENGSYASTNRVLVVQLYLNTIDEGGETEFLYQNCRTSAVKGRLLIWPAGFTHTHRGNPPINQNKYIVSSWGLLQENV